MLLLACRNWVMKLIFTRHTTTRNIVSMKPATVSNVSRSSLVLTAQPILIGTLRVHNIVPPFPRSYKGKFHILFSHVRQLHLTGHLLRPRAPKYDVYFVDQLSTCIPFLRVFGHTRVVFYCHFPDKLLADGEYVEGKVKRRGGLLKRMYRLPMDWLEEVTTSEHQFALDARINSRRSSRTS